MMFLRILVFALLCGAMCATFLARASVAQTSSSQTPDPESGVPRELARWRAAHISNVRYSLHVELAPGAERLRGEMTIRLRLDDTTRPLVLDWRTMVRDGQEQGNVSNIELNGRAVSGNDARHVNDHLVITNRHLVRGENTVRLRFESPITTSGSAVTRYVDREDNSEYIYTLFVPSDASTAFPCFDQPDLKARFTLSVTAPVAWKIVSNAQTESLTRNGAAPMFVRFRETEPLSTYQFAFAAGPFTEFRDETSQIEMRLLVRRSKAERMRGELAEVFRINREGLRYFADYFAYRFPFPKYDMVIIPEFPFGGMEHAGATFLREEAILFPSDPTANDFISRADLMLHEASHQWFGDLVTMEWFDDLWLKEGFATFMSYKAMERILPQHNAWKVFYQRIKPVAYLTDATRGTTPIFQDIPNLNMAKSAYGNIVYRKAPSVLRQAEFFLGAREFQTAVRAFVREHAFGNATWSDLVRAFERASGRRLEAWGDAWVRRRGMPDVRAVWTADARTNRINSFALRQTDVLGEGGAWPMRVRVLLAYRNAQPVVLNVLMNGTGETAVREAIGRARPDYVFANYEDYGYGRFMLDEQSRAYVVENLGAIEDNFLRTLLWGALWDAVREAELDPARYLELTLTTIGREQDEVTVQSLLNRAQTAFNYYLSDRGREQFAPRLEALASEQMTRAESAGLRITYFRAFRSIATTPTARARLKEILSNTVTVPGLTLRSRDRFDIITALLSRGDADAPALLERQSREDTTDNGRRYAYAAGAARSDAETKRRYFNDYLTNAELSESWIEASLAPFNTVSHHAETLPFLEQALRELPRWKRTRKIFFVNNWLAAFIGGQRDERALRIIQNFLRDTQLDRDLRLKVLEAMDNLERAVRIRARYSQ
jgi:aminopeptidase N